MKLWLISQDVNDNYDTYSDAVVAAEDEEQARIIHPGGTYDWEADRWRYQCADLSWVEEGRYGTWANPTLVKVELLGEAVEGTKAGVICASFHAG